MTATLINTFIVLKDREQELVHDWRKTAEYLSTTPGFIDT